MTELETNRIITGDCLDVLSNLPENSIHMCMTSPPYWQLRDYGHEDQLGLEETIYEYVENIATVCEEIKRVLRPNGSLWLNIGDSYDTDGTGLKLGKKQKGLVPQRIEIALQERGWIIRNDATWYKPNPMPSPVTDRLNTTTEELVFATPNPSYYFELDEIREPYSESSKQRYDCQFRSDLESQQAQTSPAVGAGDIDPNPKGKNPGDVFEEPTQPNPDAHFAVYTKRLCEKPIKATCPKNGIVLDPFAGVGTTLVTAKELDRDFLGIELNPEYADMARARVGLMPDDPSVVRESENQEGLEAYTDGGNG